MFTYEYVVLSFEHEDKEIPTFEAVLNDQELNDLLREKKALPIEPPTVYRVVSPAS